MYHCVLNKTLQTFNDCFAGGDIMEAKDSSEENSPKADDGNATSESVHVGSDVGTSLPQEEIVANQGDNEVNSPTPGTEAADREASVSVEGGPSTPSADGAQINGATSTEGTADNPNTGGEVVTENVPDPSEVSAGNGENAADPSQEDTAKDVG
jgi:hypothetical protein